MAVRRGQGNAARSQERRSLIQWRWRLLAMATASLLLVEVGHGLVARIPTDQLLVNLVGGLAVVWTLTVLMFRFIFRLLGRVGEREQALARREVELAALQRVNREMSATLDQDTLLHVILQQAVATTGSLGGHIVLFDRESGTPEAVDRLVATWGLEAATSDASASLTVPVSYAGCKVGQIHLQGKAGRYEAHDVAFVESLAEQASIAIGRAEHYREQVKLNGSLRRRAEQQSKLFEVSCSLQMDKPLDEILEEIAYAIQESVGFNIVLISTVEGAPPYLQRRAGVGLPLDVLARLKARPQPLAAAQEMFQEQFAISRSYLVPHWEQAIWELKADTLPLVFRGEEAEPGKQGDVLLTPLRSLEGELLGTIAVAGLQNGKTLDRATVEILETFAALATSALQNARLYERVHLFSAELEQRVRERTEALAEANEQLLREKERADVLYRITRELGASLDLSRVLARALSLLSGAIGVQEGVVLLLDTAHSQLAYRAQIRRGQQVKPPERSLPVQRDSGVLGWVMRHRQPLLLADASQDPRWAGSPLATLEDSRSFLAVPLLVGDDVLGVLILADPRAGLFTPEHVRLVIAAANQVAQSISNAELYRLIVEQAQRLGDALRAQQTQASEKAAILEGIADGVVVVNPRGEIILLNRAAEEILNAKSAHLVGRSLRSLGTHSPAEDRALVGLSLLGDWFLRRWDDLLDQVLEDQYEADGRVINVRLSVVQMAGEILGAVAVFRDITREVEADRAKTEFVSTVSHELRTPMTSIKGYTDLLRMGAVGPLNDQQKRYLDIVKANVDRLNSLVADLLDISRIEAGRMSLEMEPLDITEVVEQVITSLSNRFAARRIALRQDISPGLPPVQGDRKRLTQVLSNLLQNACQYTEPGGQAVVSVYREGDMIRTDVQDTGIGIAAQDQERIFERFFRADHPLVEEVQGTGLGLSIVKSIVEMHKGRIWVQSKVGEGSTFSFVLPVAEQPAALEEAAMQEVVGGKRLIYAGES